MILVYVTCKNEEEAEKIGRKLLEEKLVACVNIVPKVKSLYWWEGKIENADESLLLCKSVQGKEGEIEKLVKEMHSYELPAIEFIGTKASEDYSEWVEKEVE